MGEKEINRQGDLFLDRVVRFNAFETEIKALEVEGILSIIVRMHIKA